MYLNRNLGGARWVTIHPVAKIIIDPEQCMTMLLEKLRKSDQFLGDCCLCLQHMFTDQPWLLRVSRETRSAARNSQASVKRQYSTENAASLLLSQASVKRRLIALISLLSCSKPFLVQVCGKLVQIEDCMHVTTRDAILTTCFVGAP